MPEENKERDEKEYAALLVIFEHLMESDSDEDGRLEILEELMALRAEHLIGHACNGFNLTIEEALQVLKNTEGLSELESARRDCLVAAVENLIDFAVAEEYQMLSEIDELDESDEDDVDEDDILAIFARYNKQYARVENSDVEYAMIIAAGLAALKPTTILTYMTQGDERVRPWHLQYEGFSAPKVSFPAWLIPPIEHQCRCYLIEDTIENSVRAASQKLEMPDWFNPTFKESVALGGRIFSDEHPYFQVDIEHNANLQLIAQRIKNKYLNASN